MEDYCELIAALKVRTSNKKGRHLSTGEAIGLIEEFGVETPDGLIKAQKSMFKTTAVNRYLRQRAMSTRRCAVSHNLAEETYILATALHLSRTAV